MPRHRTNAASRVFEGKTYFDPATNLRVGAQGIGSTKGGYRAPPGLDIPARPRVRSTQFTPEQVRSGVLQGSPQTPEEQRFWAAHPQGVVAPWNAGDPLYDPAAKAAQDVARTKAAATAARTVDVGTIRGQSAADRQALVERRAGAENTRAQLINRLQNLPINRKGQRIGGDVVVQQIRGIDSGIKNISAQESRLAHQDDLRVAQAFRNAAIADKDLTRQRNVQTSEAAAGVMKGLANIEANYKRGTPEFRDAVSALAEQHPDYVNSKQAFTMMKEAVTSHDKAEEKRFIKAQSDLQKATGLTPEEFAKLNPQQAFAAGGIRITEEGKPRVHFGGSGFTAQGKPKGEFTREASEILAPEHAALLAAGKPLPKGVLEAGKEQMKAGGAIRIDTGKGYPVIIPRTDFERFTTAFRPEPTGAQPVIDLGTVPKFPPNYVPGVGTVEQAPQGTINGLPAQQAIDEIRARRGIAPTAPQPAAPQIAPQTQPTVQPAVAAPQPVAQPDQAAAAPADVVSGKSWQQIQQESRAPQAAAGEQPKPIDIYQYLGRKRPGEE
jgi:hypothetical protein